jgi:hypothetical protein
MSRRRPTQRPRVARLYSIDVLPWRTCQDLMRLTKMNGVDARVCIDGCRKLTLAQADQAAMALGCDIDALWPGVPIQDWWERNPPKRRPDTMRAYDPPHHVVALAETGHSVKQIARLLAVSPDRVHNTIARFAYERKEVTA